MNGISVIICCYNSEQRIKPTLEHLNLQQTNFPWELIIVDNNCSDKTVQTVNDCIQQMHQLNGRTSIVKESKPGLNYARSRGANTAKYDLILFCDDDNWLNESYLQKAYDFLSDNPDFGIVGGNGVEKCEIDPPKWFDKHKSIYAIGCRKDGDVSNVYGAGMLLHKKFIEGACFSMSDRKGNSLASGGDSEICQIVRKKGFKIRQLCSNTFYHYLPKERLTYSYIMRMARASGKTKAELYLLNNPKWKGLGYRFKTDILLLITKLFKSDFFSFKYALNRTTSYWTTRFLKN
ncbi:Glycosyltransferase involved in cell wall bisynthesis [Psychroflexus salarius]|uniref:Glycosyltransferase involved in cell wall bisynthesis n=1 Tax=Psychroflexus salarius TaxID=1155689 RepID=A0A1M4X435_9FLAO|nr:glycosyltransferase [Psychroflexus salarius]SHE88211.1 Glycosyltransferase involved in cell wall bisynthesis [Psychroflexus salarius]